MPNNDIAPANSIPSPDLAYPAPPIPGSTGPETSWVEFFLPKDSWETPVTADSFAHIGHVPLDHLSTEIMPFGIIWAAFLMGYCLMFNRRVSDHAPPAAPPIVLAVTGLLLLISCFKVALPLSLIASPVVAWAAFVFPSKLLQVAAFLLRDMPDLCFKVAKDIFAAAIAFWHFARAALEARRQTVVR